MNKNLAEIDSQSKNDIHTETQTTNDRIRLSKSEICKEAIIEIKNEEDHDINDEESLNLSKKRNYTKSYSIKLIDRISLKFLPPLEDPSDEDDLSESEFNEDGIEESTFDQGLSHLAQKYKHTGYPTGSIKGHKKDLSTNHTSEDFSEHKQPRNTIMLNMNFSNKFAEKRKKYKEISNLKNSIDSNLVSKMNLGVYSGNLGRKIKGLFNEYKISFFLLKDRKLSAYSDREMKKLELCINFDYLEARLEESKNKSKFKLIINHQTKFTFKVENPDIAQQWVINIQIHLKYSYLLRKKLDYHYIDKSIDFSLDRIDEKTFLSLADSGDILLFQSKNFVANLQRSLTGSEYGIRFYAMITLDHVGMLLKYESGDIGLFESTSEVGVGICKWQRFKANGWHKLYSRMTLRKLQYEKNNEFIVKIENFVKNTLGKDYNFSANKLLRLKSVINDDIDPTKSYFCSELIAACYKYMGLLPKDVSSSSYWPGNFSVKKDLYLLENAKLSQEYVIDFNLTSVDKSKFN